jgi:hypothetical protein
VLVRQGLVVADGSAAQVKNLASGRVVSATLPGAGLAALAAIPGVDRAEVRGERILLQTADSDLVARHLLTATQARDLEISSHNLEEAFLALTSDRAVDTASTAGSLR